MFCSTSAAKNYSTVPIFLQRDGIVQGVKSSLTSYEKGVFAELCAEKELKTREYEILDKRVKTKYGEIDILAKKEDCLVAIEVKQRRTLDLARSCISTKQQIRILNALLFVVSTRDELFENYRVDVICLDSIGRFEHIENAFPLDDLIVC
ncbi:MAG: YraN family protein [Holosporales bacterium]|jgi:putative endonuclease|nr:YraN family protein [Holosporales bacterium]